MEISLEKLYVILGPVLAESRSCICNENDKNFNLYPLECLIR